MRAAAVLTGSGPQRLLVRHWLRLPSLDRSVPTPCRHNKMALRWSTPSGSADRRRPDGVCPTAPSHRLPNQTPTWRIRCQLMPYLGRGAHYSSCIFRSVICTARPRRFAGAVAFVKVHDGPVRLPDFAYMAHSAKAVCSLETRQEGQAPLARTRPTGHRRHAEKLGDRRTQYR